ncbi:MAG: 16S rRNA (guanine(527)-N(7))-methyltransferase RsmG [Bdellovibrionales bacterium]
MSKGLPSKRPPPPLPKKEKPKDMGEAAKDGNALWRVGEWIPGLPADQMERVKAFHAELLKFNAKVNLISKNTERESDELHFADCLLAGEIILKLPLPKRVFDIGSGNGFPGLIFPIMDPKREYVLVESDSRKCEFLKHTIAVLKLKNVSVLNVRFETLSTLGIEAAVSRGFASIAKTLLACNKVFAKGAQFIHLKGANWSSEIAELPSQLISVWQPELVGEYFLPVSQARRAIVSTQKKV